MAGLGLSLEEISRGTIAPGGAPLPPAKPKANWAGILADAIAGAMGNPGQYAAVENQRREQEQQQAQWGLRRRGELEDYEAKQQIEQRYRQPDVSPMERDAQAWQRMAPEQRAAYGEFKSMGALDPDVFTTLPNGQFYAGPRSGLAAALGGGGSPAKTAPRGRLTPVEGGPTLPASGGFPGSVQGAWPRY